MPWAVPDDSQERGISDAISRLINESGSPVDTALKAAYDALIERVNTVAASGTTQTLPDVTTATIHDITLTANCTITLPTVAAGKSLTIRLTQDATGSRVPTLSPAPKWAGGTAPTWSTGAGKQDVLSLVSIGGTSWTGSALLDVR